MRYFKLKWDLLHWLKRHWWFFFASEKCEWCRGKLRRGGDNYHGGIDIKDGIGTKKYRTVYVCNLCYRVLEKLKI